MKFGLVGGSYTSQSVNAACQQSMNLYPERIEVQEGKAQIVLYPSPGLSLFAALPEGPVRGELYTDARAFAVGGSHFCEVFADGSVTDYGIIANDGLPVSMAGGATQILFASAGIAYVFDLAANTLAALPPSTLSNVNQVGYVDGFFVATLKNSHTFQASNLLDATTWNPLSIGTINVFVDNVVSMLVDHREVWLFGLTKTVPYYDAGLQPFPFDLIPGAFIEQGCIAANSPVRLDNSIFWIGGDERGNAVAWRAQGYRPSRVSTHAIEFAWQGYPTIADAVSYSFQDQGHSFWQINFPAAKKTWVYDVATNLWHERAFWNAVNGIYTMHRSQCHMMAFGKHLVGDWASGNIYSMSIQAYDDFGNPIRRVRRAPHISQEQKWSYHHKIQIDLETGLGPQPALTGPSESPLQLVLADSGGNPWTLAILDNGLLQTAAGGVGPPQALILNDNAVPSSWQLGITVGGFPTTTSVAYDPRYALSYPMATNPSTLQSAILIANGLLQTNPAIAAARDPVINLRWSDDGGHSWSNEYALQVGQAGDFKKRAILRRLGRTRDRVYEINCSDPIPYRFIESNLEAS